MILFSKNKQIPFITALWGTCKGTNIFIPLLQQSVARTVLHLIILLLLSTFIITVAQWIHFNPLITKIEDGLTQRFGNIIVDELGVHPEKKTTLSKIQCPLSQDIFFEYFPSKQDYPTAQNSSPSKNYPMGIIWEPNLLMVWMKTADNNSFYMFPIVAPHNWITSPEQMVKLSLNEVYQSAQVLPSPSANNPLFYHKLPFPVKEVQTIVRFISFSDLINLWFYSYYIGLFYLISFPFSIIGMLLIMTGFFAFSSWLFSDPKIKKVLTISRFFVIAIYASFPGILIATLWKAFNLNFMGIGYLEVIIISLLIYIFIIQFRLLRAFNPPSDDSSDF